MNAKLSELLAAMPDASVEAAGVPRDRLIEILADIVRRPVPTGSVHRLWSVSDLSAQVALAYFAWWVRQWFDGAEAGERRLLETNLAVALKIFHRLGYLRGMLTKLGQAAGTVPHLLPDDVIATLDRLHFDAPPMHYSLIREVLRDELGAEPEEVFASFEQQAFAAASLGQVHRARLKSGEVVAVKIQYPGIARTIDADFRNIGALLFPFRLTRGWDDLKVIFEEVRRMLHQEVDYEQEAEALRRARTLFRPEDGLVVPNVYAQYSTKRVLTTEFLAGQHLEAFLASNPQQDLRNDVGTKMYRAWVRFYYAYMGYGDPHSGNYIFMEDGRLGLIDFGCVQNYSEEESERVRFSDRLRDAPEEARAFVRRSLTLSGDDPDLEIYIRLTEEYVNWVSEPLQQNGAFDFGDQRHLQRGVDWLGRIVRERRTPIHPMYFYWNRSVFGLTALLYRLRAQVDVGELMEQESLILHQRGQYPLSSMHILN